MQELAFGKFDYALVSDDTKTFLIEKENQLNGIYFRYTNDVGKVLYEAQQTLADYNNDGLFQKWIESIGFKRQRVYEYINIYKYAVRITDNDKLEIFNSQPKSIQSEMSKPSAIPEINEKVFDGDITTHKKYKELEKQLKEQSESHQRQLQEKDEVINKSYKRIIELQEQGAETVQVEVEVVPEDYERLKHKAENSKVYIEHAEKRAREYEEKYKKLLEERQEVDEKSKKYDELTQAITKSEGQLNKYQKEIAAYKNLLDTTVELNKFLDSASHLIYMDDMEILSKDVLAIQELEKLLKRVDAWSRDLWKKLEKQTIMEGEFIHE